MEPESDRSETRQLGPVDTELCVFDTYDLNIMTFDDSFYHVSTQWIIVRIQDSLHSNPLNQ